MGAESGEGLEITASELVGLLGSSAPPLVVDVREADEQALGVLPGALLAPLAGVERITGAAAPDRSRPLVLYCASGRRSADAARRLHALGYARARSLRGGIAAWREAGQDLVAAPEASGGLDALQVERYSRQLRLAEIGPAGQRRLREARVLCVGAGGLGSPAGLYLAAAGVGCLGIVDDDTVALSNLQRQVLHATARVGMPKTDSAALTLSALNPDARVRTHRERLSAANVLGILADYDVVVDGSDNFATRYLVNDAALRLGRPLVSGAVLRFEGHVSVFTGAPCYRCAFPVAPPADAAPSCQEAGVLGVVPGVIGTIQAAEALKLVLGAGDSLRGRLLAFDALSMRFDELSLHADPHCPACGPGVDRSRLVPRDGDAACAAAGG